MMTQRFRDHISDSAAACIGILLLLGLSLSGCASSGSHPEVQRSDEEAAVRILECPGERKPTCIRRMGTVQECSCASNADFRKAWEVNL